MDLPERIAELSLEVLRQAGEAVEWEYLLEELALYFLMYSEAANLRHTPEALWFVYWCLRNSHERQMQITAPPPSDPRSAAYVGAWGRAPGAWRCRRASGSATAGPSQRHRRSAAVPQASRPARPLQHAPPSWPRI